MEKRSSSIAQSSRGLPRGCFCVASFRSILYRQTCLFDVHASGFAVWRAVRRFAQKEIPVEPNRGKTWAVGLNHDTTGREDQSKIQKFQFELRALAKKADTQHTAVFDIEFDSMLASISGSRPAQGHPHARSLGQRQDDGLPLISGG